MFTSEGVHPLEWLLHPRFRHCFAAIDDGLYWIVADGCSGRAAMKVAAESGFDLAAWYRERGHVVIETTAGPGLRGPWALVNCVGLCKAVLGIRAPFCWTPYRLWKRLRRTT